MRRALDIAEAAFGAKHPNRGNLLEQPGDAPCWHNAARMGEAEPLMRRALDIDEATFGEQHPSVAIFLNNLATVLTDTNRTMEEPSR